MNQRTYNKIYVNKQTEEGSEGISLGYQYEENEITLKKDTETFFHVPAYATPISLVNTDLIINGATAGMFPAASDRIFKSQKGYGDVTPNGNAYTNNGMWFCSWLYKDSETGIPRWLDRYYQPGKFDYNTAVNQLFDQPRYVKSDPVFKDVPSTLTFEPGVLYRYFHLGEKTAKELIETFEGKDRERLKMHLTKWDTTTIDRSLNSIDVSIQTDASTSSLIVSPSANDGVRIFNSTLNFNNPYNVNAKLEYNSNYLNTNEFTWSFWAYSKDWQASPSTQLIGNLSSKGGGIGVFIDTLETFPFLAIPETTYGHVIFINENRSAYLDKSVQTRLASVNPVCFGIDSNNHVIVCNDDSAGVIYKMDHSGYVIKTTKSINDPSTLFVFPLSGEKPKQLLCGLNDDFYVVTNKAIHSFNADFVYKSSIGISSQENNIKVAFRYDTTLGTAALDVSTNVYDVKFDEQTKWSISSQDGNLYRNDVLFYSFKDRATNFSIGPDNNLWIAHGNNNVTAINPSLSSVMLTLDVGYTTIQDGKTRTKNISFTKRYNRKTNTNEWNLVVFYTDEKILYYYGLNGKPIKTLDLNTTFDPILIQKLSQKIENTQFLSVGDFTGYERQRIFSKLPPYLNKPQISIKASVKDTSKTGVIYNCPTKAFGSIQNWEKDSWKHFVLVFKNKIGILYCDDTKIAELKLRGQDSLSFDTQPSFFIGTPTGSVFGMNSELKCVSNIFNGKIGDVRAFDYALDFRNINLFEHASMVSQDLIWPLPIPKTQYVEHIERMFKHKLPGAKSQFFKLKLTGTGITDPTTKKLVEEEILDLIKETKPAYVDLIKIEWVD
jgi:hypothetical protein